MIPPRSNAASARRQRSGQKLRDYALTTLASTVLAYSTIPWTGE
jgi:hypothetical protein